MNHQLIFSKALFSSGSNFWCDSFYWKSHGLFIKYSQTSTTLETLIRQRVLEPPPRKKRVPALKNACEITDGEIFPQPPFSTKRNRKRPERRNGRKPLNTPPSPRGGFGEKGRMIFSFFQARWWQLKQFVVFIPKFWGNDPFRLYI